MSTYTNIWFLFIFKYSFRLGHNHLGRTFTAASVVFCLFVCERPKWTCLPTVTSTLAIQIEYIMLTSAMYDIRQSNHCHCHVELDGFSQNVNTSCIFRRWSVFFIREPIDLKLFFVWNDATASTLSRFVQISQMNFRWHALNTNKKKTKYFFYSIERKYILSMDKRCELIVSHKAWERSHVDLSAYFLEPFHTERERDREQSFDCSVVPEARSVLACKRACVSSLIFSLAFLLLS